ncbi:MAG: hypothetical protein V1754_15050 [Pseudomonadota bacterium]
MTSSIPKIGITLGDPAGIGPEILAKLLTHEDLSDRCIPIVIGDARVVQQGLDLIGSKSDSSSSIISNAN